MQCQGQGVVRDAHCNWYTPKMFVPLGQGRVRQHQCGNPEQEQNRSANRLGSKKTLEYG